MNKEQSGFTLIELITVILLIGILSAVAFSRFADNSVYRQSLFSSKLQAYLRLTQQIAMAQQSKLLKPSTTVSASLSLEHLDNSDWRIIINNDDSSKTYQLSLNSALIIDDKVITAGTNYQFSFTASGNLISNSAANSTANSTIIKPSLNTPLTHSIVLQIGKKTMCIAPTGYSYEGACI